MIKLILTCEACPEQYDAYDGDKSRVYLRLRHGAFAVQCPDVKGECIYSAYPEGDGAFIDDAERDYYLRFAVAAILKWQGGVVSLPPPPNVEFELIRT